MRLDAGQLRALSCLLPAHKNFSRFVYFNLTCIIIFLSCAAAQSQTAGSLDATFDGDGRASLDVQTLHNHAFAVTVQTNGKILVAGNNVNAFPDAIILARYTPAGSLDSTFGQMGVVETLLGEDTCQIRAIAVQPDGKILLAGAKSVGLSSSDFLLVRYNSDGTLNVTFDADGWTATSFSHNDTGHAILLQPDGKIIVAGQANGEVNVYEGDFVLARYNPNGSLDTTFDGDGKLTTRFGAASSAHALALQADGKIIVAGESRLILDTSDADFALARYHTDGALDANFGAGGKVISDFNNRHNAARSLAVLPDGRILVGGEARGTGGLDFALARYNANGSLDATFGTGGSVMTDVSGRDDAIGETRSLVVQSDGKIVLAGSVQTSANNTDFGLVRYNANGSPDASFGMGGKVTTDFGSPGDFAAALALQPDGKLLVAGRAMLTPLMGTNLKYFDFALARYHTGLVVEQNRAAFDFDGDGMSDISVFRDGTWYVQQSTSGLMALQFGFASDRLVPADYDGDGKTDVAVFRNGEWYILASSNNQLRSMQFGQAGDVPVPADYDGDGLADLAVFRAGNWYYLQSSDNQFRAVQFGIQTDKAVPADFDGDGKTDLAVFRDGNWYWIRSVDNQFRAAQFGVAGDKPVVGDYDGDGIADLAVFRAGVWYLQRSLDGFAAMQFGLSTDILAPADYDGDGKADVAVFRDGNWFVQRSAAGFLSMPFGLSSDVPVPSTRLP